MEPNIEKECSALDGLFQAIVNDMKTSSPVWEDFMSKATKLHSTLRATILATGAFLEAFQKVADMATNTRGATRDMGSALTRLCMRHRSIETKLKGFNAAIMDLLVNPLQEKMEEWKKTVIQIDKDHQKDYKKARSEIKRASSDTVRLQRKAKKGCKGDLQTKLDSAMQDVNDKYILLEESEKNAVRMALIEERSRFCHFVSCLKPVVDKEVNMLSEVTHLQEILDSLCMQACDPFTLPAASEQVILDIKGSNPQQWTFQQPDHTPPSSPSSLGSRKSSMCSISSINSSSSGSSKSHSPSHHLRHRNSSQHPMPPIAGNVHRLTSVSSQDSGFTSQDTLYLNPQTPTMDLNRKNSLQDSGTSTESAGSTPSPSYGGPQSTSASTWSNWPDPPNSGSRHDMQLNIDRPHTISTAYEKHNLRPALTASTFEPPEGHQISHTAPPTPSPYAVPCIVSNPTRPPPDAKIYDTSKIYERPPNLGPKPKGKAVAPPVVPNFMTENNDQVLLTPVYVNMNELASMAAQKGQDSGDYQRLPLHGDYHNPHQLMRRESMPAQPSDYQKPLYRRESMPVNSEYQQPHLHQQLLRQVPPPSGQQEYKALKKCQRSVSMTAAQAPNSHELAEAIAELELSTAALQQSYNNAAAQNSQVMQQHNNKNNTPQDNDFEDYFNFGKLAPVPEKFSTISRSSEISQYFMSLHNNVRRPVSTAGIYGTPRRPVSQAGGSPGTATIRRGSLSKPAPPLRRSSSISGACPVSLPIVPRAPSGDVQGNGWKQQQQPRSGSTTPTPEAETTTPTEANPEPDTVSMMTDTTEIMDDDDLDLPPPPPELLNPEMMVHDHDPPPPPPGGDHLEELGIRGNRGSIQNSHASIINSLNAKFAHQPHPGIGGRPQDFGQHGEVIAGGYMQGERRLSSHSSDDATPTADTTDSSFLSQIKRGVSLRKTRSNDRSAPKLK